MTIGEVQPSLSPSMDIQVSSNFERLLFELYDREGPALGRAMASFRRNGQLHVGDDRWKAACELLRGYPLDDAETPNTITQVHRQSAQHLDPHSAIRVAPAPPRIPATHAPVGRVAPLHPVEIP